MVHKSYPSNSYEDFVIVKLGKMRKVTVVPISSVIDFVTGTISVAALCAKYTSSVRCDKQSEQVRM